MIWRAITGILQMFTELLRHLSMVCIWAVGLIPPGLLKTNFQESLQHQMEKSLWYNGNRLFVELFTDSEHLLAHLYLGPFRFTGGCFSLQWSDTLACFVIRYCSFVWFLRLKCPYKKSSCCLCKWRKKLSPDTSSYVLFLLCRAFALAH